MLKLKKGDKVKVRIDAKIPFNGRIGIIDFDPIDESLGYSVKFVSEVCTWHYLLAPEDITLIDNPQEIVMISDDYLQRLSAGACTAARMQPC